MFCIFLTKMSLLNQWACIVCSVINSNVTTTCQGCNCKNRRTDSPKYKTWREKMKTKMTQLLKTETPSIYVLECIADGYKMLQNFDKSRIYFERILKINPANVAAYNNLFTLAITDYHQKQQNCVNSLKHDTVCFDFKYNFFQYIQSRINNNSYKHCQ
eukprot:205416_1